LNRYQLPPTTRRALQRCMRTQQQKTADAIGTGFLNRKRSTYENYGQHFRSHLNPLRIDDPELTGTPLDDMPVGRVRKRNHAKRLQALIREPLFTSRNASIAPSNEVRADGTRICRPMLTVRDRLARTAIHRSQGRRGHPAVPFSHRSASLPFRNLD
jgi:hypothetical protein